MTLGELKIGQSAYITSVKGEDSIRLRLLDMGIIPNTLVSVRKLAPLGDPMEIEIRGYSLTIRKETAQLIEVKGAK